MKQYRSCILQLYVVMYIWRNGIMLDSWPDPRWKDSGKPPCWGLEFAWQIWWIKGWGMMLGCWQHAELKVSGFNFQSLELCTMWSVASARSHAQNQFKERLRCRSSSNDKIKWKKWKNWKKWTNTKKITFQSFPCCISWPEVTCVNAANMGGCLERAGEFDLIWPFIILYPSLSKSLSICTTTNRLSRVFEPPLTLLAARPYDCIVFSSKVLLPVCTASLMKNRFDYSEPWVLWMEINAGSV